MYPDPKSQSATLFELACQFLPGGNSRIAVYHPPYPIFIDEAKGSRVKDVDGFERIDFINNQSALVHGHGYAPMVEAVAEQLQKGVSYSGPSRSEYQLAEHIHGRVRSIDRIRFTNSGTEAVMFAVKAARAFTGRYKIAKCEGAYHGSYDFVEISRGAGPDTWGPRENPERVPYAKGTPPAVAEHTVVFPYNDAAVAEAILTPEAEQLAAIIVEPVSNRTGMIPGKREFFEFLRAFTEKHGILLIYDEVISFRVSYGGAQEHLPAPDLTTLGKLIGGGFPVGAVGGRAEVMEIFDQRKKAPAVPHTGTFNANPISMVAGLAAMNGYGKSEVAALNKKGADLRAAIGSIFAELGIDGQASGTGSLFRIHFRSNELSDHRSAYPTKREEALIRALQREYLHRGIMVSANLSGNISTAITDLDVERFLTVTREGLVAVRSEAAAAAE